MYRFLREYGTNQSSKRADTVVVLICMLIAICNSKPAVQDDIGANKFQQKVTVYPWNNHYGVSATITLDESTKCASIPKLWHRKISSVNTHGECVLLCSKKDCKGECIKLSPGSPSHNRLRDLDFDKKPMSVGVCNSNASKVLKGKKGKTNENQVVNN